MGDGESYQGEIRSDLRNGKGKCTYADGAIYDGEWLFDKIHGQG